MAASKAAKNRASHCWPVLLILYNLDQNVLARQVQPSTFILIRPRDPGNLHQVDNAHIIEGKI